MIKRILLSLLALAAAMGARCASPDAAARPDSTALEEVLYIMGRPEMSVDRMYLFVKQRNPNFLYDIAEQFYLIGERYGVRGDIALCQAILETGWFRFMDGTEVSPEQHNYGGLGVTGRGVKGNSFLTLEEGVTAFIQHLYAYACTEELPVGERLVDVRFPLVRRGCAPMWTDLSNRWAMNPRYGADILRIFHDMERFQLPRHEHPAPDEPVAEDEPVIMPDHQLFH